MLDALSFALFGKPHRNINKPQLVNSINNKDCKVEVCFQLRGADFRIVRGIKPAIFEIWKNEVLVNQDSHNKEYQKVLEQNILKLNHKSFHQIVVLGSSSFIPFMQLSAQHRRDVIEDLLDINVFSKMNMIIKEKQASLKERLKDLEYQLDLNQNQIDTQNKYIRDITIMNEEEINEKQDQIKEADNEIVILQEANTISSSFIQSSNDEVQSQLKKAHDQKQALLQYRSSFNTQMKALIKESEFYELNTTCPTCTQEIAQSLIEAKLTEARNNAATLQSTIKEADKKAKEIQDNIEKFSLKSEEIRNEQSKINANNQEITRLQKTISTLNNDIERLTARDGDLGKARDDLQNMNDHRNTLREEKLKENEAYSYNSVIAEMLKDTGIKTKIIKQYLPVINKLVNQYLQTLDFFVHFNLDEEFKEEIRSRHRDSFSYDSFSEGEKQRIDLALLFTWRMIAKMKNSVATNLLILDETFDSSLDHDGVDNLMKILYTLDDETNTFVISHKGEILDGKFKRKLEFVKEKNFSKMVE